MNVHDLINCERKKRGESHLYWSREMAKLAQSQANYCAKVGHLVHSKRYAYRGGENLAEGPSNFTSRAIVNSWLNSKAGHREYLLSPIVRKAGVGIAKSGGKTFVAWAFSDAPPSYPDCPYYKSPKPKVLNLKKVSGFLKTKFYANSIINPTKIFSNSRQRYLKKIILNLIVLATEIGLICVVYYTYTNRFTLLVGALSVIGLIAFLWFLISLSRKRRFRYQRPGMIKTTIAAIFLLAILAFAGVQPLAGYKDNLITKLDINDSLNNGNYAKIYPGQIAGVDGWFVSLDGGKWEDNIATVKISLCNRAEVRRYLKLNYDLVAIDSTNKVIEPWTCKPGDEEGEFTPGLFTTYDKEFYPNECWIGELMFTMSPYSGETNLCITRGSQPSKYVLFTIGSPQ